MDEKIAAPTYVKQPLTRCGNFTAKDKIIPILGVDICSLTVLELHDIIASYIDSQIKARILHVNVHGLNLAFSRPWLRDFLNESKMVFCDGAGVMLGARLLGFHISQRITYADWMWQLAEFAELYGYTFYFLGAKPGVAGKAAQKMVEKFPKLQIIGTHHGYFDKSPQSHENELVLEEINSLKPNILVVGFGMPLQEAWLKTNEDRLDVNVILTGGAVFDYVSGELSRAPKWMTNNGLEWFGRLLIEPRRLWQRYIIGNPLFLWRIVCQRLSLLHLDK